MRVKVFEFDSDDSTTQSVEGTLNAWLTRIPCHVCNVLQSLDRKAGNNLLVITIWYEPLDMIGR